MIEEKAQIRVFSRLLNYNFIDDVSYQDTKWIQEKMNTQVSEAQENLQNKVRREQKEWFTEKFPPTPKEWKELQRMVTNGATVTLRLFDSEIKNIPLRDVQAQGWVSTGYIERVPTPYSFPDKKRYQYLNHPLIERARILCETKRKSNTVTVWRLRRDPKSVAIVRDLFMQSKEGLTEYMGSMYWSDVDTSGAILTALLSHEWLYLLSRAARREEIEPDRLRISLQLMYDAGQKYIKELEKERELTRSKEALAEKGQEERKPPLIFPSKPFFEGGFSIKTSRHGEYTS